MNRPDRLQSWRKAILAHRSSGMHGEVRALLYYAACHPNTKATAVWSIPRSELAETFNVHPSYITKWIQRAKAEGLLDTVRQGRPGVTAVYQGRIPDGSHGALDVTNSGASGVTIFSGLDGVPQRSTTVKASG
jgi:hypothetical protein